MLRKLSLSFGFVTLVLLGLMIWTILNVKKEVIVVQPSNLNTVNWQQNGTKNIYLTQLLKGKLLDTSSGIVQTDTNCAPDKEGISHCHNDILLSNGKEITIINIHNMKNHPCFSPGDKVRIESQSTGWVKVTKI